MKIRAWIIPEDLNRISQEADVHINELIFCFVNL